MRLSSRSSYRLLYLTDLSSILLMATIICVRLQGGWPVHGRANHCGPCHTRLECLGDDDRDRDVGLLRWVTSFDAVPFKDDSALELRSASQAAAALQYAGGNIALGRGLSSTHACLKDPSPTRVGGLLLDDFSIVRARGGTALVDEVTGRGRHRVGRRCASSGVKLLIGGGWWGKGSCSWWLLGGVEEAVVGWGHREGGGGERRFWGTGWRRARWVEASERASGGRGWAGWG